MNDLAEKDRAEILRLLDSGQHRKLVLTVLKTVWLGHCQPDADYVKLVTDAGDDVGESKITIPRRDACAVA